MTRGFTLIESLLYLALFALMMGGIVGAVYVLFESSDRNEQSALLAEETNFIIGCIDWDLQRARSVSTAFSELDATFFDGSSHTIALSNGNVKVDGEALNNSNITVSDLTFVQSLGGVEAAFTLHATTSNGIVLSRSASTTIYQHI